MSYPKKEDEFVDIVEDTIFNSIYHEDLLTQEPVVTKKMKDQYRGVFRIKLKNTDKIVVISAAIYEKEPDKIYFTHLNRNDYKTKVYQVYKNEKDIEEQINSLSDKTNLSPDTVKDLLVVALFHTLDKQNISLEDLIHEKD